MASAAAIPDAFASAISSFWNWKDHLSGDSITPSSDTNSKATTFLIDYSFVRPCISPASASSMSIPVKRSFASPNSPTSGERAESQRRAKRRLWSHLLSREPGSVFEPLGDEPFARVYVYLPEPSGARVDELVRHVGRHHHYLATARLDGVVSGSERDAALLYDEDLLVGMPVQLRAASRRRVYHDERDAGITVMVTLELVGSLAVRQVGLVDYARHTLPPVVHLASGMGVSRNSPTIESSHPARSAARRTSRS